MLANPVLKSMHLLISGEDPCTDPDKNPAAAQFHVRIHALTNPMSELVHGPLLVKPPAAESVPASPDVTLFPAYPWCRSCSLANPGVWFGSGELVRGSWYFSLGKAGSGGGSDPILPLRLVVGSRWNWVGGVSPLWGGRTCVWCWWQSRAGQSRAGLGLWGQSQAGACWPVGLDPDLLPPDVAFLGTGAQHIPVCGRLRAEPAPASKVGTVPVLVMWRQLCPPPDPQKHSSPPKPGQGCYLLSLPLICTWQH